MNIGFTYDLKQDYLDEGLSGEQAAEFDRPETIDAITHVLESMGHRVTRLGRLDQVVRRLAAGERWDLVFNIAEGLYGIGREAQVPALLEGYRIPVTFGDSVCLALCLHKGLAKHVIRSHCLPTPDFAVVEDLAEAGAGAARLVFPVFAKPVAEGTGKGVSAAGKAGDADSLRAVCAELLREFRQPVLVEEYLPGREFTVGILGTGSEARILGVMEVIVHGADGDLYSYQNKDQYLTNVTYVLADDDEARQAGRLALECYRRLGCRDAGRVDLRSDADCIPNFIEVNPLAGLNPVDSDLPILCRQIGMPYQELIRAIVESACRRAGV